VNRSQHPKNEEVMVISPVKSAAPYWSTFTAMAAAAPYQ